MRSSREKQKQQEQVEDNRKLWRGSEGVGKGARGGGAERKAGGGREAGGDERGRGSE